MKKFLLTVLVFMVPIAFFSIVPSIVEWKVFLASIRYPSATIGIIGDSHSACGVNPEFFPELANFAQRASQPMVWRAKLGVILDENPQIDTFIIELWSGVMLRQAEKDSKYRARFFRNFVPESVLLDIFRTKQMGSLPDDNLGRNFIKGALLPFLRRCVTWSTVSALQDGYFRLDQDLVNTKWYRDGAKLGPDEWGHVPSQSDTPVRREIEDILSELQRRHIRTVLLTMPFLSIVRNQFHTSDDQSWFENEIFELCQKYGCMRLNLIDELSDLENWADSGHLNAFGAERFSKLLRAKLIFSSGNNEGKMVKCRLGEGRRSNDSKGE